MIPTLLLALALSQYPEPTDCDSPSVMMVFRWARECPTHTLRFEYRDDGTFRVVCLAPKNANKLYPKR